MAGLEKKRSKYKEKLASAKKSLIVFRKKLAIEDKKLKTSIALLKKQEEAKQIAIAQAKKKKEEKRKEKLAFELEKQRKEQEKVVLALEKKRQEQLTFEEEKQRRYKEKLAFELEKQRKEQEKIALALEQKRQEKLKRLALEKLKAEELLLVQQKDALYTAKDERIQKKKEEFRELEIMDYLEHEENVVDGLVNEGLALFRESEREIAKKKKSKKGKKSKKDNFWTSAGLKDPKDWFSINVSYSSKVDNYHNDDSGREILKTSVSFSPIKGAYFATTMMHDLNGYESKAYQPDFVYSMGYSNSPWSISYDNYSNNKFEGPGTKKRFHFDQGGVGLKYRTKIADWPLSIRLSQSLSDESRKLSFNTNKKLFDKILFSAQLKHYFEYPQQQLTLSGKTFLYKKFFVSSSIYLYSRHKDQLPFEPDYAYSFGWKDNRPFYPSIVYSNYYTPTRWSSRSREGSDFEDGSLSVSFKIKF